MERQNKLTAQGITSVIALAKKANKVERNYYFGNVSETSKFSQRLLDYSLFISKLLLHVGNCRNAAQAIATAIAATTDQKTHDGLTAALSLVMDLFKHSEDIGVMEYQLESATEFLNDFAEKYCSTPEDEAANFVADMANNPDFQVVPIDGEC